jgi:pyruvate carboxylase
MNPCDRVLRSPEGRSRMKMQNTVYAPCDGVVAELQVALRDTVEAKDLLLRMRSSA